MTTNNNIDTFFTSPTWYSNARKYWETVPKTVDGMLGGLEQVHGADIQFSRLFISNLFREHGAPKGSKETWRACDCGAGIGRITRDFLCKDFSVVDLVESDSGFLDQAKQNLKSQEAKGSVDKFINLGLEEFRPRVGEYHVIWAQWVLSHLTDADLETFIVECLKSVRENDGYLVIKENITRGNDDYIYDKEDSSVTRSTKVWEHVFTRAGAVIVSSQLQPNFPSHLFPVNIWALK